MEPSALGVDSGARQRARARALGAGLIVVGSKFLLILWFGSDLPFWDQWDAEGDALLRPLVHGRFPWGALLSAHNEHRILFTRLVTLILFWLDQRWDPKLEMAVNAILFGVFVFVLCLISFSITPARRHLLVTCFIAALFSLPFGWENTLEGFGSQFLFLILFSILSISALLRAAPLSLVWWCGACAGLCATVSMGSGALAGAAVEVAIAVRCWRRRQWLQPDQLPSFVAGCLIFLIGLSTRRSFSVYSAHSLHAFRLALLSALAWPNIHSQISALILWTPILLLLVLTLRRRTELTEVDPLLGLASWVILQALAIAYARGGWGNLPSSRYMDCLACGTVCNLLALLLLETREESRSWHRLLALVWVAFLLVALSQVIGNDVSNDLPNKRAQTTIEAAHVREYLATHDPRALQVNNLLELPYPDPARLASILNDEKLCAVLPPDLQQLGSSTSQRSDSAGRLTATLSWSLERGGALVLLGVLAILVTL